jgi:hypothetical protein
VNVAKRSVLTSDCVWPACILKTYTVGAAVTCEDDSLNQNCPEIAEASAVDIAIAWPTGEDIKVAIHLLPTAAAEAPIWLKVSLVLSAEAQTREGGLPFTKLGVAEEVEDVSAAGSGGVREARL